jgi:predicted TIM-barrel fold metal-dependent hydrolase
VLCGVGYGAGARLYPACRQCPNLYIETHRFQDHQAYQRFVNEFGEHRLLFGTGLPHCSPGSPHMMTMYQDLPEQARPMIAGGNMLRLLEGVTGATGRPLPKLLAPRAHPEDDPIVACARAGRPLSDEFVMDCHGHLAHPGAMGAIGLAMPGQDADSAIASMDRLGVDKLVFSMWSGLVQGDAEANDLALEAVARYPDRLMAYGCYNTRYPETYQAELRRVFHTNKVIGIKPYGQYSRVRLDDPVRHDSYQWANDNGKPILGCGSASAESQQLTPPMAMRLAEQYPGAAWIISHATSSYAMAEAVIEACNAFANIYAEVCYSSILYGAAEMLYENMALEQILYGSDAMMRDPASQLGWMCWSRIPYQAKQRILGHNFADILRLSAEQRKPVVCHHDATRDQERD